jgi:hypothetical protein
LYLRAQSGKAFRHMERRPGRDESVIAADSIRFRAGALFNMSKSCRVRAATEEAVSIC